MSMTPSNDRIVLRAMEPEDLELLYLLENDREQWWIGCQTAPLSRYALRNYITNTQFDIYKDEQLRFVISDGDSNDPLGILDLFNFDARNRRVEFGIVLHNRAKGRGIARRSIEEMKKFCSTVLHLHQIVAIVPESNDSSLRLLSAAGFTEGATLNDWILKTEGCLEKYENAVIFQLFL